MKLVSLGRKDQDTVMVSFDHVGGGLVGDANGFVKWFTLGNANGGLVQSTAEIRGDKIAVWSDQAPNPTFLRYAWEYNPPNVIFYNQEGLPAVPFYLDLEDHPDFGIEAYTISPTTVERGDPVTISWEVYGASEVTRICWWINFKKGYLY